MKVVYGISKVKRSSQPVVLAIGVFDGVHIGHQKLIAQALARAKEIGGEVTVMTFDPHPAHVLRPQTKLPLVMSLEHRLRLLADLGVARCVVVHFTKRFSNISPENFIQRYLLKAIRPREVFVGEEFCFGKGRQGDMTFFKRQGEKHGFVVNAVSPVPGDHGKVGSSFIRTLIAEGDLKKATKFLSRPPSIMGTVVKGESRGKTLGFPTANMTPKNQVIPPKGVYAVYVHIGRRRYPGMANIGVRPSFSKTQALNIETHIFDFTQTLYGKTIIVDFIRKIREEKTFSSPQALSSQLQSDRLAALNILSSK